MDSVVTLRRRASLPAFQTCLHECSHAVPRLVLDELPPHRAPPIDFISVVPGSGGILGRVRAEPRIKLSMSSRAQLEATLPPTARWQVRQNALLDIICLLAATVADARYEFGLRGSVVFGNFELAMILAGGNGDETDAGRVQLLFKWLCWDDPEFELAELWEATCTLIASEWPGILRVARLLRERRVMDGDEFETEWRAVRPTPVVRRRLETCLGGDLAKWRQRFCVHSIRTVPP